MRSQWGKWSSGKLNNLSTFLQKSEVETNAGGLGSCYKVSLVHVKKEKQEAFLSSSSAVMCMQGTKQFKKDFWEQQEACTPDTNEQTIQGGLDREDGGGLSNSAPYYFSDRLWLLFWLSSRIYWNPKMVGHTCEEFCLIKSFEVGGSTSNLDLWGGNIHF